MFGYFHNFEVSNMDVSKETRNLQKRKRFSDKLTWNGNFFVAALLEKVSTTQCHYF